MTPAVRAAVEDLARIVARRDLAAFKRHLTPGTPISFGGDHGPEGLDTVWEPTRPDTQLWTELDEILRMGGVEQSGDDGARQFCAPWPACIDIDPEPGMSGYDPVVVTGTDVAVRARPAPEAPVLGRVSHAVLVLADAAQGPWWAVRWQGGIGHVRSDLARSPVDLRIALKVAQERWEVLYFVAGD
jgi:hypothetical protein